MTSTEGISPKSGLTTFVLCFFLGVFGIHRFYVGKIGTGILMLFTGGGLGFWVLYDLFSIVCKNFTDSNGQLIEINKSPYAPRNVMLVALCIYGLLLGTLFTVFGNTMYVFASVGKAELAALRQGNIEQAYAYTSSAFHKGVSINTFKKFVESYPQLHDNTSSTFTELEYKDDEGTITGTLTLRDGSKTSITIKLVKENDQWRVNEIKVK